MASVNRVILIGNVGADPEVKYFDSGSVVAKFNIATTESYTNKNGEKVDNTEWHRIEIWEGLAKVAEKYVKKGGQVYIEGKIRTDKWTDKEGIERFSTTIRANSLTLLGGNPKTPSQGLTNGHVPTANHVNPSPNLTPEDESDDLPF